MKISAVVPAYNEEKRISQVLEVLQKTPLLEEIIVINDGSTDQTAKIAQQFKIKLINLPKNKGKGKAMEIGVKQAQGEIIFFCDADVKGLTPLIVSEIIKPVWENKLDMFIGMRQRRIYRIPSSIKFVPLLGGERALKKELWETIPEIYKQGFKIETALNFFAKYYGKGFDYKIFPELSQTIKEKKYGLWSGTKQRWIMVYEILTAKFSLFVNYFIKIINEKSKKIDLF